MVRIVLRLVARHYARVLAHHFLTVASAAATRALAAGVGTTLPPRRLLIRAHLLRRWLVEVLLLLLWRRVVRLIRLVWSLKTLVLRKFVRRELILRQSLAHIMVHLLIISLHLVAGHLRLLEATLIWHLLSWLAHLADRQLPVLLLLFWPPIPCVSIIHFNS